MTKNHIELTHSTSSPDWVMDHLRGTKGSDGLDPIALKYQWPGAITQSIGDATNGEHREAPSDSYVPSGKKYLIAAFSFMPDLGDPIVYPVVVKPSPFEETAAVRKTLYAIANEARDIKSHFRFYCYTKPEIALSSEGVAGDDAGWARGTVATCCASLVWLAAWKAGVRLEGAKPTVSASDLEDKDVIGGAKVSPEGTTLDGLYYYTEEERIKASSWLHNYVFSTAYLEESMSGYPVKAWMIEAFTDAADEVANQVCNTFASDRSDLKDSEAWKSPGPGNAVSPDNILFWDSPGAGNKQDFRSVYGFVERMFYRPGTFLKVPIYRWQHVETRGTLTGTVMTSSPVVPVAGAVVTLLCTALPDQDVAVDETGRFRFENVPSGKYTLTAGLNIAGVWHSVDQIVEIRADDTTDVTVVLEAPSPKNRLITIKVWIWTEYDSIFAHGVTQWWTNMIQQTRLSDYEEAVKIMTFEDFGKASADPYGRISFELRLHTDLRVEVNWTAHIMDGGHKAEDDGYSDVFFVARDGSANLPYPPGVHVYAGHIEIDEAWIYFEVHNDQYYA